MSMCASCIHFGQCAGLSHCNGSAYVSRMRTCAKCGAVIDYETGGEDREGNFLCIDCYDAAILEGRAE